MIQVVGTKKKVIGGLKKALVVEKQDMSIKEVILSMTSSRIEWRKRIYGADPN